MSVVQKSLINFFPFSFVYCVRLRILTYVKKLIDIINKPYKSWHWYHLWIYKFTKVIIKLIIYRYMGKENIKEIRKIRGKILYLARPL